jgi:hypothetical protein
MEDSNSKLIAQTSLVKLLQIPTGAWHVPWLPDAAMHTIHAHNEHFFNLLVVEQPSNLDGWVEKVERTNAPWLSQMKAITHLLFLEGLDCLEIVLGASKYSFLCAVTECS